MLRLDDNIRSKEHVDLVACSLFPYITQVQQSSGFVPSSCSDLTGVKAYERQDIPTNQQSQNHILYDKSNDIRMPSITGPPSQWNGGKPYHVKGHNAFPEEEETRLLGGSRNHDADAFSIGKPQPRPQFRANILNGGHHPRNTLNKSLTPVGSQIKPAAKGIIQGKTPKSLELEVSRGQNVDVKQSVAMLSGDTYSPPSKRRKTDYSVSSPNSGIPVDELLRNHSPGSILFAPSRRSSQDVSAHSFNSQEVNLPKRWEGTLGGLEEHRTVESMMDSGGPKKKFKKKNRLKGQTSFENMSSQDSSFTSSTMSATLDEIHRGGPHMNESTQPSDQDTSNNVSSTTYRHKANSSKPMQNPSTGKRSPHFDQPLLPTLTSNDDHRSICLSKNSIEDHEAEATKLAKQFVAVDGVRRCSDVNLSSEGDELHLGTTVGPNTDKDTLLTIQRPRSISPTKLSLSPTKALSPSESTGMNPSNIEPTQFTGLKYRTPNRRPSNGSRPKEKRASWSTNVAAVSVSGQFVDQDNMGLVYDNQTMTYILMCDGRLSSIKIQPKKLLRIFWSPSSCKVRFQSSKTENEDNVVDLIFNKEKDVCELVKRLQNEAGCKVSTPNSDQLNRMFEKKRNDDHRILASAQAKGTSRRDTQARKIEGVQQETKLKAESSESKRVVKQRPKLVDTLLARITANDAFSPEERDLSSRQEDQHQKREVSDILDRLKPKHNQHLRRSTRASGAFVESPVDQFEQEDPEVENRYSKLHGLGDPWKKPLTYPKMGKKKTTVEWTDLERLDEGEFLNDNLISFYLRYLEHTLEQERPDLAKRIYFFNTFFFATLMNTHKGRKGFNYEGVQKWTRNVDLFTYDYIVVPINENTHWYLAIICNLPSLDRGVGLSDDSRSSPVGTSITKKGVESGLSSSSPAAQASEQDAPNYIEGMEEPEEQRARDSFAELSLDTDAISPSSPGPNDRDRVRADLKTSTNEDQEMLDVQLHEALPKTLSRIGDQHLGGQDVRSTLEDPDQPPESIARAKKRKRKSMPPVTKLDPTKPTIVTFDSLGLPRSPTIRILKDYLREEARVKRGGMEFDAGQIKGITASSIPTQENFYDCGVFLLGYVAKFLENDPKDFLASIIRRQYDSETDWPNLRPSQLRASIREQVMKLHEDQKNERTKERSAQKVGKADIKAPHSAESSPTRRTSRSTLLAREQYQQADAIAQINTGSRPAPPSTVDDQKSAIALGGDSHQPRDNVREVQQHQDESTEDGPNTTLIRGNESTVKAVQEGAEADEVYRSLAPPQKESSVIVVDSQSQQDISNRSSFGNSLHGGPGDTVAPELPTEIQDSQPSQTSKAFAETLRKEKSRAKTPTSPKKDDDSDLPVVRLEAQGSNKRKKPQSEVHSISIQAGHKEAEISDQKPDQLYSKPPEYTSPSNNKPGKRRKAGKKKEVVVRQEEVINIDDDD